MSLIERETLALLLETGAKAASKPQLIALPKHLAQNHLALWTEASGLVLTELTPAPRTHALTTVDDVLEFAKLAVTRYNAQPILWLNGAEIVVVIDDQKLVGALPHLATCELTPSAPFACLSAEMRETWRDPKSFLRWLRLNLEAYLDDARDVIGVLRSLRGVTTETSSVKTGLGRESMGREIDATAYSEGNGGLPEVLYFRCPIYDEPRLRSSVVNLPALLEVNPRSIEIRIDPSVDAIQRARQDVLDVLYEMLVDGLADRDVTAPVFRGCPKTGD